MAGAATQLLGWIEIEPPRAAGLGPCAAGAGRDDCTAALARLGRSGEGGPADGGLGETDAAAGQPLGHSGGPLPLSGRGDEGACRVIAADLDRLRDELAAKFDFLLARRASRVSRARVPAW